jgi:hypothetical protein
MNIVQLPLYQGVGLNVPINSAADKGHLEVVKILTDEFEIWSSARETLFGPDNVILI